MASASDARVSLAQGVLGLRQFARQAKWALGSFALEDLASLSKDLSAANMIEGEVPREADYNLLAFPGESNFSGRQPDLSCLKSLRSKWRILLDAAKLACSERLDLTKCGADFVVVSFYKIFGHPTGLGALICRHDAAPLLLPRSGADATGQPLYFGGGTVSSVSAFSDFVVPRAALHQWMERGTQHFQGILVLPSQLRLLRSLGSDAQRHRHAMSLAREAFLRLQSLRHENGRSLVETFGFQERGQGPSLALQLRYEDGSVVPYGEVARAAEKRKVLLRTGCHCNPGGCQRYLELKDQDVRHFYSTGKVCGDDRGLVDGRPTGVVRISFGLYSTMADLDRCVELLLDFKDLLPERASPLDVPLSVGVDQELGRITALKVYPVKGCGALKVERWPLHGASLFLDRRWCLTLGPKLRPVSAKLAPRLTTVKISLEASKLVLSSKFHPETWRETPCVFVAEEKFELPLGQEDCEVLHSHGISVGSTQAASPGAGQLPIFA